MGETAAIERAETDRHTPMVTVGGWTTETYSEGMGDVVLPLFFDGTGLFFLNPRFSFTDRSEEEYNIGAGYRYLIRDEQAILGANLYYDRRETSAGASFHQIGFGAEYLSHWLDARANVYLPVDDRKTVNHFATMEQSDAVSRSASQSTVWLDPYATGHDILQGFLIQRTTRTRTATTTTTRHFTQDEVAMRGWDAEIGVRLPMEPIADYVRAKAFAGYYKYYGKHGLEDVDGFRGRLELHIKPSFIVDATYYADDALTGGDYSIGAYVSVPFDVASIANRRNPFAGATEYWESGRNPGSMRYRLTDMVRRDPQIRTLLDEPEEQEELRTSETVVRTRERTDTVDQGIVEVETDITFVDGTRGNDANPGTFEDPKETVQGGVDEPRSMVFVFDVGGPYSEIVAMTDNVYLRGEGAPIQAFGGKVFGSGVHPLVNGGGGGPTITMAANTIVQGFEIRSNLGEGIFSATGENLLIRDNLFNANNLGVNVSTVGDVNVALVNNQFYDNSTAGARIEGTGASGVYFVHAKDNSFTDSTFGLMLAANNYDAAFAVVDGAQISDTTLGLDAQMQAEFLTLLSLTSVEANNNMTGVRAQIDATDGFSVVLGGTPVELVNWINDLLGGAPLPPELEAILSASGPIQANDNVFAGLDLTVVGRDLAALALFDVEANNNGVYGINAGMDGWDGVGIGLVASSENFLEVLQFGGSLLGLLGLDLPELPSSSSGYARLNDNGVAGLNMMVHGDFLALSSVLGVEANRNGVFGHNVATVSPNGAAISLLGRLEADDNGVMGVFSQAHGDFLGLAALLDIHASDNGVHGIDMGVSGDVAIGLVASTDPLRALVDSLNEGLGIDPPLAIPGQPFGPVVTSGNGVMGVNAVIDGDFLSLGAFLDIEANENGVYGLNAAVASPNGAAIGLAGSSDNYIDLLQVGLGALDLLFGGGLGLPELSTAGMGPSQFNDNGVGGVNMLVEGDSLALSTLLGIQANDNDSFAGINLATISPNGAAISLLGRIEANDNAVMGLNVQTHGDFLGLAALLDIHASDNGVHGIDMGVSGDVAIGLLASTDPLRALVDSLSEGLGIDPPLEIPGQPFGPVVASGNGIMGVNANVVGEFLALGAFMDIQANDNGIYGMNAAVESPDGVAIGLVGSSDNYLEILQLGFNALDVLFGGGLGLPELSTAGMGPSQFNNNAGGGLNFLVQGRNAAIGTVLGVEANDNETASGVDVAIISPDGVAIGLLAQIEANNNNALGINYQVVADSLALGALLDFHANDNFQGVNHVVAGDTAIGLIASTDPVRSLADVLNDELALDPTLEIPGTPFGPNMANGNELQGVASSVTGDSLAISVILDTHATGNGTIGIGASVGSPNGEAFALIGSSDLLFDWVPPILGEILFGDVNAIGPLAYTPMGDMNVSGNDGGGLYAVVSGRSGAFALAGGITASDNLDLAGPGHGVYFGLTSPDGDVFGGFDRITADNNAVGGMVIDATAFDQATLAVLRSQFNGNNGIGLDISAESLNDDVFLIMAGVDAIGNDLQGIEVELTADQNIGFAATAIDASDNLRQGLRLNATAGADAFMWVQDADAIDNLRAEFGSFSLLGASDALYHLMPVGASTFNNNGNDVDNPGARSGMRLNVTADGDVVALVTGNTFNDNSGGGSHLSLESTGANVFAELQGNTAASNGSAGIRVDATVTGDPGRTATVRLLDNLSIGNGGVGANILLSGDQVILFGEGNRFLNNNVGLRVDAAAGASLYTLDFGGGALGSAGQNAIFGNVNFDVRNVGSDTVVAQNNWWGIAPPIAGQFDGSVDYSNWLLTDPNP